jgi:hypothetical protein
MARQRHTVFLAYGQVPGRMGFPADMQGLQLNAHGIFTPRKKAEFPGGIKLPKQRKADWIRLPPPPGMLNGNTSLDEWFVHEALQKIKGPERLGSWQWQFPALGGRKIPGGAVIDFAILDVSPRIAFRIQTPRYHYATDEARKQYDRAQKAALTDNGWFVVDLWSEYFINDLSGRAVLYHVRRGLQYLQAVPPQSARISHAHG